MRPILVALFALHGMVAATAQTQPYEAIDVSGGGSIVGRVTLVGSPPPVEPLAVTTNKDVCGEQKRSRTLVVGENGGVQYAVALLREIKRGKAWIHPQEYALGQEGCRFEPHILLIAEGADLRILNSDRIAHNVRTYGRGKVFNVGQPRFVEKLLVEDFTKQVSDPEIIRVGCDLHPWMSAYIIVQKNPYYGITDENGLFRLEDIPPGTYTLETWHETLGEQKRKVSVEANGEIEIAIEMKLGGS